MSGGDRRISEPSTVWTNPEDPWDDCIPEWLIFAGIHVGKYALPMDPMDKKYQKICVFYLIKISQIFS